MKNALIVFLKKPELGRVKTRLAQPFGEHKALQIYLALLEHVRLVALEVNVSRYAYFLGDSLRLEGWEEPDFVCRKQSGENIGVRMNNALKETLVHHEKAVLIGGDLPHINSSILNQAFSFLDNVDVVIGPAFDGGYYLIGMKNNCPELFEDISWSTPAVFSETLSAIGSKGLSWAQLPLLPDIDTAEDWNRYGWEL